MTLFAAKIAPNVLRGMRGSAEHGTHIMFDRTGGADGHDWYDDTYFIADVIGHRPEEIPLSSIII